MLKLQEEMMEPRVQDFCKIYLFVTYYIEVIVQRVHLVVSVYQKPLDFHTREKSLQNPLLYNQEGGNDQINKVLIS